MFIWWFVFDKLFLLRKNFLIFILGFLIGNIPAIYFNLLHQFANWRYIWLVKGNILRNFLPGNIWIKILTPIIGLIIILQTFGPKILAGIFELQDEGRIIIANSYKLLVTDYIQLFIFILTMISIMFYSRRDFVFYFRLLFVYKFKKDINESFKICFIFSFIILQILAALHNPQGYRFFYPVFPFYSILLSILFQNYYKTKKKLLPILLFIFMISDFFVKLAIAIKEEQSCGNFSINFSLKHPFIVYSEKCSVIIDVIKFLKTQKINFVIAPYHATPLTFYSKGEIVGSIFLFADKVNKRDHPDNYDFKFFAILVYRDSIFDKITRNFLSLNGIYPNVQYFDSLVLYYPIDRKYLSTVNTSFLPE